MSQFLMGSCKSVVIDRKQVYALVIDSWKMLDLQHQYNNCTTILT
jgi:hypothetical protein